MRSTSSRPPRLLGFLEGRALKVFLAPGGLAARFLGRGTGLVFAIFARVTGVDMLGELSTFFSSLSGIIDGFGERIRGVAELLRDPETSFLIVTSPEPEPAREALFLAEQLAEQRMACDAADRQPRPPARPRRALRRGGRRRRSRRARRARSRGARRHNLADFDVLVAPRPRHDRAPRPTSSTEPDP